MPNASGRRWRTGSTRQWRTVRARVLAISNICWLCGQPGADSVDHVISPLDGGSMYGLENLRPAHGRRRPGCRGNYGRGRPKRRRQPAPTRTDLTW